MCNFALRNRTSHKLLICVHRLVQLPFIAVSLAHLLAIPLRVIVLEAHTGRIASRPRIQII